MTKSAKIGICLTQAARRLADAGIASPRREARLLMGYVLERDPAQLLGSPDEEIAAPEFFFI